MQKHSIYMGWSPEWRQWLIRHGIGLENPPCRRYEIGHAVRAALRKIDHREREIVQRYYFDGRSFGAIADELYISKNRVEVIHRRALGSLRILLAPFVRETFGIDVVSEASCRLCNAPWRAIAEGILDEKTAEMTWGMVATRIERATGWRASTPQVLIAHQKYHRRFR